MRSQLAARRLRSSSLSTGIPPQSSSDYSNTLADIAAPILYRSPLPSQADLPVYILNAAAFPDANHVKYDALLPYVLARLPNDEELIGGRGYELVFFAGAEERSASTLRKTRPGWAWILRAYNVLSRLIRKRLQKLYLVHQRSWVRVTVEMFSTVVSPKVRKKIVHGRVLVSSTENETRTHISVTSLFSKWSSFTYSSRRSAYTTIGLSV